MGNSNCVCGNDLPIDISNEQKLMVSAAYKKILKKPSSGGESTKLKPSTQLQVKWIMSLGEGEPEGVFIKKNPVCSEAARIVEESQQPLQWSESEATGTMQEPFKFSKFPATYWGEWKNKIPHGFGKVYYSDGAYLVSRFKEGHAETQDALFVYPDGSYYRGALVNSKANGKGRLKLVDSVQYSGDWVDDLPHGSNGVETAPDGAVYTGPFVKGQKQGRGKVVWPNGDMFQGYFKSNQFQGVGKIVYSSKQEYDGYWYKGLKQKKGTYKWPDGRKYQGFYENDQPNGYGQFYWPEGKVYKGSWKDGKMHGPGRLIEGDSVLKGVWQNGVLAEMIE